MYLGNEVSPYVLVILRTPLFHHERNTIHAANARLHETYL